MKKIRGGLVTMGVLVSVVALPAFGQNPHGALPQDKRDRVPISLSENKVVKPKEANRNLGIIKDDFLVNDDTTTGGSKQKSPAIAMVSSGNFVVCWHDERNGDDGDIYAQRYTNSGDTLGVNFRANDDAGSRWQWSPSASMDASSNSIICWKDNRRGAWSIYAQRYDSSGDPQGGNFRIRVDNDNIFRQQWHSSVSMNASGHFVICWEDNYCWDDSTDTDIYAQRYNNLGEPLGKNLRVNDGMSFVQQRLPCIAVGVRSFVVSWEDARNWQTSEWDIYCQRYDSAGNSQDINLRVNDDSGTHKQRYPSVSMDMFGNFVICWKDYRNGNWDIYAQRYNKAGEPQGSNFKVNNDTGAGWQLSPSISMNGNGDWVICWRDDRNGNWDIYAQRYRSDGTTWGTNYLVNQRQDVLNPDQGSPSVALSKDRITFAWMDARRSKGWDIYAKVVTWDWDKVDKHSDNPPGLPRNYALLQNHPNPFNASTVISYELPVSASVKLEIYNILGQEVATLIDGNQRAGYKSAVWDASSFSSGIYFYRLSAGCFVETRKMVLLK